MITLRKAYSREAAARHAVKELRRDGVPGRDIGLLAGRHAIRQEPVGEFAEPAGPNAPSGRMRVFGACGGKRAMLIVSAGAHSPMPTGL